MRLARVQETCVILGVVSTVSYVVIALRALERLLLYDLQRHILNIISHIIALGESLKGKHFTHSGGEGSFFLEVKAEQLKLELLNQSLEFLALSL